MFWQFDENKCKNKLMAATVRINLMINKKKASAERVKRDVAGLLADHKYEKARIKVEHVIREDFDIEALEILSLKCELLKQRIKLIDAKKECPPDLLETVGSVVWAANHIQVDELNDAKDQFRKKYGTDFIKRIENTKLSDPKSTGFLPQAVIQPMQPMQPIQIQAQPGQKIQIHHNATFENGRITPLGQPQSSRDAAPRLVNEKLMARLSIHPPKEELINNYLSAIADHFNIEDYNDNASDLNTDPNAGYPMPNFPQAFTTLPTDNQSNNNHPGDNGSGMGGGNGSYGGGMPFAPNNQYPSQVPQIPPQQTNGEVAPNTSQSILPPVVDATIPNNTQNNFTPPTVSNSSQLYPNLDNIPQATIYNPPMNTTGQPTAPSFEDLNARLQELKR